MGSIRTRIVCACAALLLCTWGMTALGQEKKPLKKVSGKKTMSARKAGPPDPNGKPGGILRGMLRENWPSLSPQEEATISTVWPASPMFNNLLRYDPWRPVESGDHLVPELAERWSWSKDGKALTFKLRNGVTWHDGKPFSAADVKHTFDVARGASEKRFKLNPRKGWWDNVEDITTNGDYEVTFRLKRPQPSMTSFLANGYTPIFPAHIDPQQMRTQPVGTGPFKLKEAKVDEHLILEKNPDYFVKGRPYLDGIRFVVIKERASRAAAMAAHQVDIMFPGETTTGFRDQFKSSAPAIRTFEVAQGVSDNLLLNHKKPPFDNPELRLAFNLALNRAEVIKTVQQGAGIQGGANLPPPYGKWGLPAKQLGQLPGFGNATKNKAEARTILKKLGYGPDKPLKVTVSTRAIAIYVDVAVWMIDQLKQVGIEGILEQVETGVWHPKVTRRDYEVALNLTGVAVDDPDGNYFENYTCGSPRNYSDYCDEKVQNLMVTASQETNAKKRLSLVHEIDRQLQLGGARPILDHKIDYFAMWPNVKNLVPHHNIYNWARFDEVWLDNK